MFLFFHYKHACLCHRTMWLDAHAPWMHAACVAPALYSTEKDGMHVCASQTLGGRSRFAWFQLVCFALGPWLLVRAWLLHGPWLLVLDSSMVLVHARLFHGVQCIPQLRLCATNSNFLNYICFIYIYMCVRWRKGRVGI